MLHFGHYNYIKNFGINDKKYEEQFFNYNFRNNMRLLTSTKLTPSYIFEKASTGSNFYL